MKNKELIKLFKSSILEVSQRLGVEPHTLKRDQYIRETVDNDLPRLNKVRLNELGGFSDARDLYFAKPLPTKAEIEAEMRLTVIAHYISYVRTYGITPSSKVVQSWGFTSHQITKLFKSMRNLYDVCQTDYPDIFDELVNDTLFTEEAFSELKKKVKTKKRFIITTAVSGKEVDENCFKALKTYEEYEDAMILVQPCEDVASRNSIFDFELDRRLRDCGFAFKDLYLNDKFFLSAISVSAKQINPLTGLERLAQAKGSMALASPKQYLQFVANSNTKMPKALMTTGAVTVSDYSTDKSMSKRTSYLAEFDHVMGAIVVEIEDDRIFHFRQIQFDDDGSFYDLGWKYNSDGTVEEVEETKCVFGDTHVGSHCLQVDQSLQEIAEYVNCSEAIIHDLYDNRFNNHHDVHKPVTRGILARQGKTKLMTEGEITGAWLDEWSERIPKLTIVKSNHDEALERYIDEGRWKDDYENLYDALDLVKARMDGKDPLKHLITEMVGINNPDRVNWLDRDEDYMVYGIENGAHGDKGGNGSRGSMRGIEKAYYKATVGHSHTAGIWREVYQVGTSTVLKLSYNVGPSSWTNTMCIQYPNGQRQLVNIIRTKDGSVTWRYDENSHKKAA
jgi:hypothetical protein